MAEKLIAYVDGSYDDRLQKYAFGCVFLLHTGEILEKSGSGNHPESLAIRNVAGEMIGAMFAVRWAITNGYSEIDIYYDYTGIEKWVTREWKAKNELTKKYADAMGRWGNAIRISFRKVTAHSNNRYNDMADKLAKAALTGEAGVPEIKKEV